MSYHCGEPDFLLGDPGCQGRTTTELSHPRGQSMGHFDTNSCFITDWLRTAGAEAFILQPSGQMCTRGSNHQGNPQAKIRRCWPLAARLYNGKPRVIRKKRSPRQNPLQQRNRRKDYIFFTFVITFPSSISGCPLLSRDII